MADEKDTVVPFSMNAAFETAVKTGGAAIPGLIKDAGTINQDDEAAKAAAEAKAAADKLEADKKAAEAAKGGSNEDNLTNEQIQAKLDEIGAKDEKDYTDEEKAFIEKYVTSDADEITTVKTAVEAKYGIKLDGEFENNEQGLIKITEEAAKVRANQLVIDHFANIPHMKEFYEHVLQGKSLETFLDRNVQPAFKSIKLTPTSESNDEAINTKLIADQKAVIKMDFKARDMSDDDIESFLQLYEEKGNLFEKAKESYKSLDTKHQARLEAKEKAEEARLAQEEVEQKQVYDKMVSMLDKNDFDGLTIPAADVKAFKAAMINPVDEEGYTLIDYKRNKLTLGQRAFLDYIVYKDFKVSGVSEKQQSSSKTFTLKKAAADNNKRGGGRTTGAGAVDNKDTGTNNLFDLTKIDFTKLKQRTGT